MIDLAEFSVHKKRTFMKYSIMNLLYNKFIMLW
jgi:hypothetical protein